jgi:hypothetical protein
MSSVCLLIHQGKVKKIIKNAPNDYDLFYYIWYPNIDEKKIWEFEDNLGRNTVAQMITEASEYYIK